MNTYILPFWKKLGTSSSIIAKRVSEKLNLPTSHTGTLDPLAEGVIKIIVGEESKNKEKYISEDKIYHFKFLFGFSTDTHDALGIINSVDANLNVKQDEVEKALNSFFGTYHQKYPNFSSKKVQGKPLWQYERLGLEVPEVYIDGEIKEIKVHNFLEVDSKFILNKIENQIQKIVGDFRQDEILKKYRETKFTEKFFLLEVEILMTRGLYVRGLARDLGNKLSTPCIVLDLIRLKDGNTGHSDCLEVDDYFKEEIKKDSNFLNSTYQIDKDKF